MYKLATNTGNIYLDGKLIAPCQSVDEPEYKAYIEWVGLGNIPEIFEEELPLSKTELKAIGENYNGYQIPFLNDDAIGMMQVSMAFQLGLTNTIIEFSNGTNMPITSDEFKSFSLWFAEKRNSFFLGN